MGAGEGVLGAAAVRLQGACVANRRARGGASCKDGRVEAARHQVPADISLFDNS